MEDFSTGKRIHDNDPDDDSFEDYSKQEFQDIIAYISKLDNQRIKPGFIYSEDEQIALASASDSDLEERIGIEITSLKQTVVQLALDPGVTIEDAAAAMISRAVELNLRLVGQQHVSRAMEKRGIKGQHLSIYQFCNPTDAMEIVSVNPIFSSYMPCRISLVEDAQGAKWLMMINLDMFINSQLLPPAALDIAIKINMQLLDIMVAGSTGEF